MIDRSTPHSGRLGAALVLAALLAGCTGGAGTPQQPTPLAPTAVVGGALPTVVLPTALPAAPSTTPISPATSVPTPPTSAPVPQPTPAPAAADPIAATQAVLDYYAAIRERAYERAYGLWAEGGTASGQTLDQFAQGFADTAGVDVRLSAASASAGAVSVPITITSVVNRANQDQLVQHFRGTYTLRNGASGWQIARANIAAFDAGRQPPADTADPLAVLNGYYAAINARDFARAYTYWSDNGTASQQTFTQFSQGFATTDRVQIATGQPQVGAAAGSAYAEVPIVVGATERDGSQQTFCGSYTLRRTNVPPFDQFGWRIYSAAVAPAAGMTFGSNPAKQLLDNACKP
jgi:hypothetical protein